MRITTAMSTNQYTTNLNSSQGRMLDLMNKIQTGRKFKRASENSISATKAMTVRKQLANLDMYDTNLNTCNDIFYNAEKQLYDVNELATKAQEVISAASNTDDLSNYEIYAEQLDGWANEMLQDMNADFAERQLFGGTSNLKTPFTYQEISITSDQDIVTAEDSISNGYIVSDTDYTFAEDFTTVDDYVTQNDILDPADGTTVLFAAGDTIPEGTVISAGTQLAAGSIIPEGATVFAGTTIPHGTNIYPNASSEGKKVVCYNGIPTNIDVSKFDTAIGDATYKITYDGDTTSTKDVNIYFDKARTSGNNYDIYPGNNPVYVDIGIGIKYDNNYDIDPQTALDVALNGASCTGCGLDADGDSKNIIQLLYDCKEALLEGKDPGEISKYLDKISTANSIVLGNITSLGTKQQSNDYYIEKNDAARTSLDAKQNDLETYDVVETAALYADYQVADSAYNAALKLGSSTLPKSIFDFI